MQSYCIKLDQGIEGKIENSALHLKSLWPKLAIQHTGMVFVRQEAATWFEAV